MGHLLCQRALLTACVLWVPLGVSGPVLSEPRW